MSNHALSRLILCGSLASASLALVIACGGGSPEAKNPEPSSSGGAGASSGAAGTSGGGASGGAPGTAPSGESSSGTTTTQLGDGGNLSGAKLSSSSSTTVESKGDGGPRPSPGGSTEPGRRREDIQAIVMAKREEARACYDKYLKESPGMEGDLDIKFLIDPTGTVTEAEVDQQKSTIRHEGTGKCVIDVIKKIKFNKSDKGFETRAHYPFNFHPKPGQKGDGGK